MVVPSSRMSPSAGASVRLDSNPNPWLSRWRRRSPVRHREVTPPGTRGPSYMNCVGTGPDLSQVSTRAKTMLMQAQNDLAFSFLGSISRCL